MRHSMTSSLATGPTFSGAPEQMMSSREEFERFRELGDLLYNGPDHMVERSLLLHLAIHLQPVSPLV
jgi:hypothetical protein